jgi:hypothetical protein
MGWDGFFARDAGTEIAFADASDFPLKNVRWSDLCALWAHRQLPTLTLRIFR